MDDLSKKMGRMALVPKRPIIPMRMPKCVIPGSRKSRKFLTLKRLMPKKLDWKIDGWMETAAPVVRPIPKALVADEYMKFQEQHVKKRNETKFITYMRNAEGKVEGLIIREREAQLRAGWQYTIPLINLEEAVDDAGGTTNNTNNNLVAKGQ